jgi:hypothetical protein
LLGLGPDPAGASGKLDHACRSTCRRIRMTCVILAASKSRCCSHTGAHSRRALNYPAVQRPRSRYLYNALRSSSTSPNFLMILASPKSPVAGSPVRLKATAPICPGLRDSASARMTTAVGLKHSVGSPAAMPLFALLVRGLPAVGQDRLQGPPHSGSDVGRDRSDQPQAARAAVVDASTYAPPLDRL